jgi:hypothetical protein
MPQRICLVLVLLVGWPVVSPASEWSGTITYQQTMVGPANIAGADKNELDDYAKQIDERLNRAKAAVVNAPQLVQKMLRKDIGAYEAERERVVLARGGVVVINNFSFVIDKERIAAISDNLPRLVIDRQKNQGWIMGADVPEPINLAPLPEKIEIDRNAVEVPMLGLATRRIEIKAEGRKFMVLVAPALPNPFAQCLLADGGEESSNVWVALASVPGLPMLVEHTNSDVTQRWIVTSIREKAVDVQAFLP